jgi:hypothetical protein
MPKEEGVVFVPPMRRRSRLSATFAAVLVAPSGNPTTAASSTASALETGKLVQLRSERERERRHLVVRVMAAH